MTISQAFELGLQKHRAGRLGEAEAIYRRILDVQPDHAHALHLLGTIASQLGRQDLAARCIERSLALDPGNAAAHSNLGEAYRLAGRLDDAIVAYRRAIALDADFPEACNNLGNVLRVCGQFDEAVATCRRALTLRPDYPEAHNNLGNALAENGSFDDAIAAFQHAIKLRPDFADAITNLGNAFRALHRLDEAIAAYRRALALHPRSAETHNNLGAALVEKGHFDEALPALHRALELKPDYAEAFHNLGIALRLSGRADDAVPAYRRALALQPNHAELHNDFAVLEAERGQLSEALTACRRSLELNPQSIKALNNLGHILTDLGRFDDAAGIFRRALEIDPGFADARFGTALLALLHGNFAEGWSLYEVRWEAYHAAKRSFPQPLWNGENLDDGRLLIHAEQGFGDAIQFVRYARLAADRGARVIVECPWPLLALLPRAKGVAEVVCRGDPLPPFEAHLPMLSLPLLFQTRAETIPRSVPYLSPPPANLQAWRARLGRDRSRLRVGLSWAGNIRHRRSRLRDIPPERLRPLLAIESVDFYSLQLGAPAVPLALLPQNGRLIDHTAQIHDFADTAALISELDLVISVDTAVAHLAGALGRPVWALLPFSPDWRWGLSGDDSPWYPTMRLFRQTTVGDWDSVVQRVAADLTQELGRMK